jgi:hypothetical protein
MRTVDPRSRGGIAESEVINDSARQGRGRFRPPKGACRTSSKDHRMSHRPKFHELRFGAATPVLE